MLSSADNLNMPKSVQMYFKRCLVLILADISPELSGLNAFELRLIYLRVPFMKMVALPSGKQRSIHGPAVNVPSKVDTIYDVLPRLLSQSELVLLKLKRKVAYRGHYMYDYIRPQKEGDEHRRQISGAPMASMMCVENPEISSEIICVKERNHSIS